jgi:hypothetical protein
MARQIVITQDDLTAAEAFLTQFLIESVPEASFIEGSAVKDLAVKAFSYIFAYLRKENNLLDVKRSLKQVLDASTNGTPITNVDDIVDEIISNWFVSRLGGTYARLTALMHFSRKTSVTLQQDARFWRTPSLAFYVDSSAFPYVISEDSMIPTFDVRGRLVDYVVNVPLKASRIGDGYNFPPGPFSRAEVPGGLPYFVYMEHKSRASGGNPLESNDQLISRAQTAITVRNLINNRSCGTVLPQEFSYISNLLSIGMSEPEMMRDLRKEISPIIKLHVGGHYDTYIELPLVRAEENLIVGGYFARPDGVINMFRDPLYTYGTMDFVAKGVKVGHVLYVHSGITETPRGFIITRVLEHELEISENIPFPEASDELTTNAVSYSIGEYDPTFIDIIPARTATIHGGHPTVPAGTSRHVCYPGMVVLSGQPVQEILTVEVKDPDTADAGIVDPSTNTIFFTDRKNTEPVEVLIPGMSQYQFIVGNPYKAQSMEALNLINVGYDIEPDHFDGKTLRVAYRTMNEFASVHDYVNSTDVRILAGNHLIKARHPIWVHCTIPYRLKPTAQTEFVESQASEVLSAYIESFDPNDDLDMNDLATQVRNAYDMVGTVFPFLIDYDLYSPDGQVIQLSTSDIVSIFSLSTNGVVITNSSDIVVPPEMAAEGITAIEDEATLTEYLNLMGVSDRTTKYRCEPSLITFSLRG